MQFRELLDQARATLHMWTQRVLELLDDALGLWRAPGFAEFADDEVARAEAACLEELRQTAVENRAVALVRTRVPAAGGNGAVVPEAGDDAAEAGPMVLVADD